MNATKWTPGPLEIGWEEWAPGDDLTISFEGGPVGEIYGYDSFPCFDAEDEDAVAEFNARQKANAQRFSAAPELYESLNDIMKCVEAGVLVRDTSRDHETGWALHQLPLLLSLKAGMAALAKARGEA